MRNHAKLVRGGMDTYKERLTLVRREDVSLAIKVSDLNQGRPLGLTVIETFLEQSYERLGLRKGPEADDEFC